MAIDQCPHSFAHLGAQVLPSYMAVLRQALADPLPLREFLARGEGPKHLRERIGSGRDFPGCYVLLDATSPIYVGIAGGVCKRLTQHVRGTTHYSASLAYRVAKDAAPHAMSRDEAMRDEAFQAAFTAARAKLADMHIAAVRIENPLELYLFEVYAAMELDTHRWNTFETH